MGAAQDSVWMAKAQHLAERGLYTTSPNPRVGCVLVKDGCVIGEGWHERAGEPHAEIHALSAADAVLAHGVARRAPAPQGATAYVTLEPCSHHGRTPPCAQALIEAGIVRVVVAAQDPNPLVAGKGIARLREAGIKVECGLMEKVSRELNIGFFSRMERGMPWVRSKIAMSLDGRTALANGNSKWITSDAARQDVQHWRARSCAVLTGIGTVLADDPRLDVRENFSFTRTAGAHGMVRQPQRVVVDSALRTPVDARILHAAHAAEKGGALIYAATQNAEKISALGKTGTRVKALPGTDGRVGLEEVLRDLAARGCNEVLVEAGSTLNGALLQAGLVDELVLYVAPQLLGDMARGMAQLGELASLEQRVELDWQDVRHVGRDLRILARVKNSLKNRNLVE